jgi:hypothetical protein
LVQYKEENVGFGNGEIFGLARGEIFGLAGGGGYIFAEEIFGLVGKGKIIWFVRGEFFDLFRGKRSWFSNGKLVEK